RAACGSRDRRPGPLSRAHQGRACLTRGSPFSTTGELKGLADMPHTELAKVIDDAFERRNGIDANTKGAVREAVEAALELLDRGVARVAERGANGDWRVNQWLKKAVLLSFRLNDMRLIAGRPPPPASSAQAPPHFHRCSPTP